MTPPPQAETGGLANAIVGSLIMVSLATLIGTPIGVLAGIYLAEYGQNTRLGAATRFINDILLSAPSIVIGLFIYTVVVAQFKHLFGLRRRAGSGADRDSGGDPHDREHAGADSECAARSGLCAGNAEVEGDLGITLKAARAGVLTGVLLAFARIAGETAPLLFTALSNQFWTADLGEPMASLPVTIFKFAMSPYENWQKLAWAGVLLITLGVLALNIIARMFLRNKH